MNWFEMCSVAHVCEGRDPKPFPPPMKLCKEMVEVMGGADGEAYRAFRTLACEVGCCHALASWMLLTWAPAVPDLLENSFETL